MIKILKQFLLSGFQKKIRLAIFGACLFFALSACQSVDVKPISLVRLEQLTFSGDLKKVEMAADSLKASRNLRTKDLSKIDSIVEIGHRIRNDFSLTEAEVKEQLKKYYPLLDTVLFQQWIKNQKLEMRLIDGERRFFKESVNNLFRLDDTAKSHKIQLEGFMVDSLQLFCLQHTAKIISESGKSGKPVLPVRMKLSYTIKVKSNAVPDGKIIHCWMPFPRAGDARQRNIKLLKSDPDRFAISPESDLQRTIYLEKKAVKDQPTVFLIEMEVETSGQFFDLNPKEIIPYNTASPVYKEFTSERNPQIVFTPKIKKLADRILASETNPLIKVQKMYNWINDSVRWASALEYSTIPDIPEYVMNTRHGDCGMQTLLFMTLARSQGIPVKWQSGWMLHPHEVNLHDWCEVFYEGIGWVPLDQSFGLQSSSNEKIRNFYRSGIDSYRLIVNDEYGRDLTPQKKFMRSEPYDFQRGELEWEGGNLYFDQWCRDMKVEYL